MSTPPKKWYSSKHTPQLNSTSNSAVFADTMCRTNMSVLHILIIITFANEDMFYTQHLSVCYQDNSKSCRRIQMKFVEGTVSN